MPSVADWLRASWEDFRRRWTRLMTVIGVTGAATAVAALLPLLPAFLAVFAGVGPAWAVWSAAGFCSLLGAVWLSTWGQAAVVRVARFDETAWQSLARSWGQTGSFGWVVTLSLLAMGGGFALFVLPGAVLFVLLFFAPFYEISGEAVGMEALGLSWSRTSARPFDASARLLVGFAVSWAPGLIPYVGWFIAPFWAPFGIVAASRLADDLRAAAPNAAPPRWLGAAVAGLTLALVAGFGAAAFGSLVLARRAMPALTSMLGRAAAGGIDPETQQALLAVAEQNATPEQTSRAYAFVLAQSTSAWSASASSAAAGGFAP
jgi:hypothetical protein